MRLSDCFIELIAYVAYFLKTADSRNPSFDQVKGDIQRLISQAEARFHDGGFSPEDYHLARYAIFAWIDEAILSSSWMQRQRWQGEQLQRIYFQTADAGEGFFERLNVLGPHQQDVREVYYLCLAMGFMGRYCHEGDDYLLEQLKTSNLKVLSGASMAIPALDKAELFPEAYPGDSEGSAGRKRGGRFSPLTLFGIGLPAALYGALFLIYRFVLTHVGINVMSMVP